MGKMVKCSRWVELSDEVMKVADVSSALNARTDFHLLNPTPDLKQCSIASSAWEGVAPLGPTTDAASLRQSLNKVNPTNTTPLTESVMSVISMISPIAADLRASGQQVAVILATDGHPHGRQSFVQAMQQLQLLPAWVVVRLCTDDDDVVSFWNDLDEQLEAPLEVLDDVRGRGGYLQEPVAHLRLASARRKALWPARQALRRVGRDGAPADADQVVHRDAPLLRHASRAGARRLQVCTRGRACAKGPSARL